MLLSIYPSTHPSKPYLSIHIALSMPISDLCIHVYTFKYACVHICTHTHFETININWWSKNNLNMYPKRGEGRVPRFALFSVMVCQWRDEPLSAFPRAPQSGGTPGTWHLGKGPTGDIRNLHHHVYTCIHIYVLYSQNSYTFGIGISTINSIGYYKGDMSHGVSFWQPAYTPLSFPKKV